MTDTRLDNIFHDFESICHHVLTELDAMNKKSIFRVEPENTIKSNYKQMPNVSVTGGNTTIPITGTIGMEISYEFSYNKVEGLMHGLSCDIEYKEGDIITLSGKVV